MHFQLSITFKDSLCSLTDYRAFGFSFLLSYFILFYFILFTRIHYITITEYFHYKTYNLQHNITSTYTLLNYEFVTSTNTLLTYTYNTPLTTYDITYIRHYLLTKPCIKLLNCSQCAMSLTYITYNTLH